jgi:hypothetical protein
MEHFKKSSILIDYLNILGITSITLGIVRNNKTQDDSYLIIFKINFIFLIYDIITETILIYCLKIYDDYRFNRYKHSYAYNLFNYKAVKYFLLVILIMFQNELINEFSKLYYSQYSQGSIMFTLIKLFIFVFSTIKVIYSFEGNIICNEVTKVLGFILYMTIFYLICLTEKIGFLEYLSYYSFIFSYYLIGLLIFYSNKNYKNENIIGLFKLIGKYDTYRLNYLLYAFIIVNILFTMIFFQLKYCILLISIPIGFNMQNKFNSDKYKDVYLCYILNFLFMILFFLLLA